MLLLGSVLTALLQNNMFLNNFKTKLESRIEMPWQQFLAILNRKVTSHSNICEGGARVPYPSCHRGGYGLIQWTTESRYLGLGRFCSKYGCDPSSLEGQTQYMINEIHFQKVLPEFEGSGKTVQQYMVPAYYWLGWGIKGNREIYSLTTQRNLFSHDQHHYICPEGYSRT